MATVGQQYQYVVVAGYACVPFVCRDVRALALPTGAALKFPPPHITWTPTPSQANADASFQIATPRDFCGNQASQSWTVHVLPDTTRPSVSAVWPLHLASGVATDSTITATFSEPLDGASIDAASFRVQGPGGAIPGTIGFFSSLAVFTPSASLPPSSPIQATITNALRDLSGNTLLSDFSWTFTTGTVTPPPAGWVRTTIDDSVDVEWTSIAVNAANHPYIAYQDGRYTGTLQQVGDIKVASNASGSWQFTPVDNIAPTVYASLATVVDPSGAAHVGYFDFSRRQLKHATNASGAWVAEIVVQETLNVTSVAMTSDAAGRLHIVYNPSGIVTYATNASGAWTSQTVASNEVIYGGALTAGIALDPAGGVHIAYYNYSTRELRHATNVSGAWVSETIDSQGDVGLHVGIASDGAGKLHLSYYDIGNGDLKYASNASGPWATETIDSAGDVAVGTAIALDGAGKPHIAYVDATNHALKYAANTAGVWTILTIDNAAYVGAAASNSGYPAIAVDSLGKVHISYRGSGFLRYATNQ